MVFTGSDEDENEWEPLDPSIVGGISSLDTHDAVGQRISSGKTDVNIFYRGEGGFIISGGTTGGLFIKHAPVHKAC